MKTGKRNSIIILLLVLFGFPCIVHANTGTPLIWGSFFHLAIGNLWIGSAEGLLLAWMFKQSKTRCVLMMIAANYFSAWCGGLGLLLLGRNYIPWSLENVKFFFILLATACWLATVLLEWPFVMYAFEKDKRSWSPALLNSLLIQSLSYGVLVAWYLFCGQYSLLTKCSIVKAEEIKPPEKVCVYFISPADGNVYGIHQGSDAFKVAELMHREALPKLVAMVESADNTMAALKAMYMTRYQTTGSTPDFVTVLPDFAPVDDVLLEIPDGQGENQFALWYSSWFPN